MSTIAAIAIGVVIGVVLVVVAVVGYMIYIAKREKC